MPGEAGVDRQGKRAGTSEVEVFTGQYPSPGVKAVPGSGRTVRRARARAAVSAQALQAAGVAIRPKLLAAALAALPSAALGASHSWSSGDFVPGVTAPNPLPAGDTLTIGSGGVKRFVGGSFTNLGAVRWLEDTLHGTDGASVLNASLWESLSDTNALIGSGTLPSFTNTGVLRKSGGNGATIIDNWIFTNNAGTLEAQTGAIAFAGGTAAFNDGSKFRGAGTVRIDQNASFRGAFAADNLVLESGVFTGSNARLTGGVAAPGGQVAWSAGDFAGTWEIAEGSTVTASGSGAKRQTGGSIANFGTLRWNSTASFQIGNNTVFTNHGVFDAHQSASLAADSPASRNSFINSGTVRVDNGATLTIGDTSLVSAGGEFNAAAGSRIVYLGGTARFNEGTRFTGAGSHVFRNDARFVGTFEAADVTFEGGNLLGGDGTTPGSSAVLKGALRWTGGNLQGGWEIAPGSTLTVSGPGAKQHAGGSIVNRGVVIWSTEAPFQGASGAVFENQGEFEARASTTLTPSNASSRNTFSNQVGGVVRAANGATLTIDGVSLVGAGGEFNAAAGSAIVYRGGFARFNEGTRFTGAGSHTVAGDARFVGAFQSTHLTFAEGGSRFGGDGQTMGSKALLQGSLEWTGGNLQGAWEIAPGSTLTVSGAGAKTQAGGSLRNKGMVVWRSDASYEANQGAIIVNDGVVEVATDADFVHGTAAPGTFVNNGRFVKSGGNGETSLAAMTFSNPGTMEVRSGTILLPGDEFVNTGTLTGTGAFAVAGMLSNAGHILPGASPGTLTIDAHFKQGAGGFLHIEIQSATLHDRLIVTGSTELGGTLALHCFADCRMAVGETLVVLESGGPIDQQFDAVTMSGFGQGSFGAPQVLGNQLVLEVTQALAPIPEPQTYVMMLAGLGALGWTFRRRQQRTARRT